MVEVGVRPIISIFNSVGVPSNCETKINKNFFSAPCQKLLVDKEVVLPREWEPAALCSDLGEEQMLKSFKVVWTREFNLWA